MRLSEITVEDLRADHEAFVRKMVEVKKQNKITPVNPCRYEVYDREHDPNWREKLRNRSPFDD